MRSCYSAPCRWYVGGPLGRIRYYFVPPTNRLLLGANAFAPATELLHEYRTVDSGETGEVPWKRWPQERGTNFRPDLVGDHPAGTPADFAGRTVLPAIAPEEPACNLAPGIELPLLFYGDYHQGVEPLDTIGPLLRLEAVEMMECLRLWLRPEALVEHDGESIATWPDNSGHGNDVFQPSPAVQPVCQLAGLGGRRAALMVQNGYLGLTLPLLLGNAGTAYVVGVVGGPPIRPTGPFVATTAAMTGGFPAQGLGRVWYGDTVNSDDVTSVVAVGTAGVWSALRTPDQVVLRFGLVELGTLATDPAGELAVIGVGPWRNGPPFDGAFALSELLVYDCALSAEQDQAVLSYLERKYLLAALTTEDSEPIVTEGGNRLVTEGF